MSALWTNVLQPILLFTGILCWLCAVAFTAIIVASEYRASAQRRRIEATRRNTIDSVEAARYRFSRERRAS